ncbi:MAG: fumarate hydratase [bacterium]
MKEIDCTKIVKTVASLCMDANYDLPEDVVHALDDAYSREESEIGKELIGKLLENAKLARKDKMPICQDTGYTTVFLELGQEVTIKGGDLYEAVNEGLRQGSREGCLRASIVSDPVLRKNTGDNTPAVIHTQIVGGDSLKIIVAPKGAGSENMSATVMLKPSDGKEGIKRFVLDQVKRAGANPCPPVILGIGIGGTFEKAALLAKKALLRPIGKSHSQKHYAAMEKGLLNSINRLGIGPGGLGGKVSALAVHIETAPCHIASLPVALVFQCHAARHKEAIL